MLFEWDRMALNDDVKPIWKKTWNAEILLLCVRTYVGLPPALWVAFNQRTQGILENPPIDTLEKYVVTAVVVASPDGSGIGERTPSIVADQIRTMERKIAGFEVVNNSGFETENIFGRLINKEEIQRRLKFLADQIFHIAKENQ